MAGDLVRRTDGPRAAVPDDAAASATWVRRWETSLTVEEHADLTGDPDRQGLGLGGALMTAVATTLVDLDLPYGFLTCADDVRPFYRGCGWHPVEQGLRTIDIHHRVEDDRHSGMVLPALRSLAEWPRVPLMRDGQEI